MSESLRGAVISALAFFIAYCVYAAASVVTAAISATKTSKSKGAWVNDSFVYHEPLHVLTVQVTPEDNERPIPVVVEDAQGGALAYFKIETENGERRAFVAMDFIRPNGKNFPCWGKPNAGKPMRHGLRLTKKRTAYLYTILAPSTSPVIVRVYVVSWEP